MKKLGYSRIPLLLVSALAALAVPVVPQAAPTDIAQVPVLNISGTGSVKPNIMLLLDNSGSMDWAYMPDYVGRERQQFKHVPHQCHLCQQPDGLQAGRPALHGGGFQWRLLQP